MEIYNFNENDYETVSSWWKSQNWPVIPKSSLSTSGFIVKNGDDSIVAGWVYFTNSDIALLEFIVANPDIRGEQREAAFDLFFDVVLKFIELKNFKKVFTTVQHSNLIKRLENRQFVKTDENMTNFIRSL